MSRGMNTVLIVLDIVQIILCSVLIVILIKRR